MSDTAAGLFHYSAASGHAASNAGAGDDFWRSVAHLYASRKFCDLEIR
jgi:hypothetical protein